ncbi:MAG TPA: hypothetical protein VMV81_09850 [Phycisphaerae bacterium]|nr:hypothetical protein [Phycisphaerae bacterium]
MRHRAVPKSHFRPNREHAMALIAYWICEHQRIRLIHSSEQSPAAIRRLISQAEPLRLSPVPSIIIRAIVATLPGIPPAEIESTIVDLHIAGCLKAASAEAWSLPFHISWLSQDSRLIQIDGRYCDPEFGSGVELDVRLDGAFLYNDSPMITDGWRAGFQPEASTLSDRGRRWAEWLVNEGFDQQTRVAPVRTLDGLTVTQASKIVAEKLNITKKKAKARVSRAAGKEKLKTNGQKRLNRRIEQGSLAQWILDELEKDLARGRKFD